MSDPPRHQLPGSVGRDGGVVLVHEERHKAVVLEEEIRLVQERHASRLLATLEDLATHVKDSL